MTIAKLPMLVAILLSTVARAEDAPATIDKLFPSRAPISVAQAGIARLALSPEILGACRGDLGDMRIVDGKGNEVAYVVDSGLDPASRLQVLATKEAAVLNVKREEEPRENASPIARETFEIEAPAPGGDDSRWELRIKTGRAKFVRRLEVRAVGSNGEVTPLVQGESIFRLPLGVGETREKTAIPLPPATAARLIVVLEGDEGFYLEPSFEYATSRAFAGQGQLDMPLREVSRRREGGRTMIDLARPRGLVPDVLRFETATPWFDRRVRIVDRRLGFGDRFVGDSRILRLQAVVPIESLDTVVRPAVGDQLIVEVDDGDSPSLDALVIHAIVRQPSLLFAAGSSIGGADSWFLYFGGGRVGAPHYDVATLMPQGGQSLSGDRARIAAALYDPSTVSVASLGEIGANPSFDRSPVLAFAMHPGAEVDPRLYSHRRRLEVSPSADGLARIAVGAADVARAREDLADLRIVDAEARQWPYLLERDSVRELVALAVSEPIRDGTQSSYTLKGPSAPLRIDQLEIEVEAPFVDRSFRLIATTGDGSTAKEAPIVQGRLVRRARDRGPLRVSFAPARADSLRLVVEDGNEAPLVVRAAGARLPLPELYLTAPAGTYSLLVGNPEDTAPRYELERIRDLVLAVASSPVAVGPLDSNPTFSSRSKMLSRGGLEQIFFWGVLVLTVVTLGTITLRLARR